MSLTSKMNNANAVLDRANVISPSSTAVEDIGDSRIRIFFTKGSYSSMEVEKILAAFRAEGWFVENDECYGLAEKSKGELIEPNRYLRLREPVLRNPASAADLPTSAPPPKGVATWSSRQWGMILGVVIFLVFTIGINYERYSSSGQQKHMETVNNASQAVYNDVLNSCELSSETEQECRERAEDAVKRFRRGIGER